jgi:iron complex outermembrane receptor protein
MIKVIMRYAFRLSIIIALFFYSDLWAGETVQDSLPEYRLSEIVVLGERLPETDVISTFEIDRSGIEILQARNVQEALNYVPGLYFSRSSKNEYSFRLRGFGQRQVNIFLDGVPVSLPYDGLIDVSQLVGENFENIRVSKGVSSVLYGANTLAGSVNIITSLPRRKNTLSLRTEGSTEGRFFGNIQISGFKRKLNYLVSFALDRSPNFRLPANSPFMKNESGGSRDNSDYQKSSGTLKLHYDLNSTNRIGLHLNVINNRFNVPPDARISRPRYWRFPEWKKSVISLNSQHIFSGRFLLRSVWFYDAYRNVLESYDDDTYSTQIRPFAFTSVYNDYSLGAIFYPQLNYFSLGSTRGVFSYRQDVHREKPNSDIPYGKYVAEIWSAGVEQDLIISSQWQILTGVDLNHLQPREANNAPLRDPLLLLNGQIAVKYILNENMGFHGSAGSKSRFPTLKELYSERLGRNIANPDLKAERSLNFEIGFRWRESHAYLEISGFSYYLNDYIINKQLGNNVQQYQNIGKAIYRGIELTLHKKWNSAEADINYTGLYARDRTPGSENFTMEYRPSHRVNGILQVQPGTRFLAGIEGSYTGSQYYQNPDNLLWEKLGQFYLLNFKLEYEFYSGLSSYIRVNNLTDKFYFSEYGVPMPGRELVFGLRIGR